MISFSPPFPLLLALQQLPFWQKEIRNWCKAGLTKIYLEMPKHTLMSNFSDISLFTAVLLLFCLLLCFFIVPLTTLHFPFYTKQKMKQRRNRGDTRGVLCQRSRGGQETQQRLTKARFCSWFGLQIPFSFFRSKYVHYIDFTIYGPCVAWQLSEIISVLAEKDLLEVCMSDAKSNPLTLFPQSQVSATFSFLNICPQECHFPFCKVHTGLQKHLVAEMPSYDLFFHMKMFSSFVQWSHNLCRAKSFSLQALFSLPIDIRRLFLQWKYIPSNKDLRIRLHPNEGRNNSRPARRRQWRSDQKGHLTHHHGWAVGSMKAIHLICS